ncbi:hypothetical protein QUF76_12715 [Desulfobacterales bacterium HSG16]|nr:hypothetical protein [Desulfobacterales bacterium HSG16]
MQYPLPESIGNPDLLVGREQEFGLFDRWIGMIPEFCKEKDIATACEIRVF